jgi:serine/threonine protein kinase/tetratricopeptide (TPR) repeat protein
MSLSAPALQAIAESLLVATRDGLPYVDSDLLPTVCVSSSLIEQLRASLSGLYTVDRELGNGGMATVYLAHDRKHHRQVALKVLHPDLVGSIGAERFLQEIEIAAGLRHPHIVPLYDSGETSGLLYFVMPFSQGESLRGCLARENRLPITAALRIAYEVCDALAYSHDRGVVHRDIKPENILLESGHALVADFGIARAMPLSTFASVEVQLTETGAAIGTTAYMSPEQAVADPGLDNRTDVYSLGCVLYEMLVGEAPFIGGTRESIAAQRVLAAAPHVSVKRPEVPLFVGDLVARAMAVAPENRFGSAAEFAKELDAAIRDVVSVAPRRIGRPRDRSIAVLPFDNLNADSEGDFFASGVAEDIIDALTHLDGIRVVPRTSAFSFKEKHHDLRVIAATLRVETVLQGSVRRLGNRLRITAQLVDASDGFQLWSERYERDLNDVFAIQDEIAKAIAFRLRVMLADPERRLVEAPTRSLEAYEFFLKGRAALARRGRFLNPAVGRLQDAVDLDPNFAQAHAALAEGLALVAYYGLTKPTLVAARAMNAATKAIVLGSNLAEAHLAHAICSLVFSFDRRAACDGFERALSIGPKNVSVLAARMHWFHGIIRGKYRDAIAEGEIAIALDPLNENVLSRLATAHVCMGNSETALRYARQAVAAEPLSLFARNSLIQALGECCDVEGAIEAAQEALEMSGRHPWTLAFLAAVYDRAGDIAGATSLYEEARARAVREFVQPFVLAVTAAATGRLDDAFALANQAIDERDSVVTSLFQPGFPFARRIRADPRFASLRARIGWDVPFE